MPFPCHKRSLDCSDPATQPHYWKSSSESCSSAEPRRLTRKESQELEKEEEHIGLDPWLLNYHMLNSPLSSYQAFGNEWSLPHNQSVLFVEIMSHWLGHIVSQETGFLCLHCCRYLFLWPDIRLSWLAFPKQGQRCLHGTDPMVCEFKDSCSVLLFLVFLNFYIGILIGIN